MTQYIYIPEHEIQASLEKFERIRPENAKVVTTGLQKSWVIIFALVTLLLLLLTPYALVGIVAICVIGFSAQFALKSYLTGKSINKLVQISPERLQEEHDWPMYTLLAPCRGEESVIHQLVNAVAQIDYPEDRLQVMLILEENDPRTVKAVQRMELPPYFEVYVLADSGPRTKPKACTAVLQYVRGKYCVVYDAEDQPEPDQLKKVVVAFKDQEERDGDDHIWCVQAKLEFHNGSHNLLTQLFAAEYLTHFNLTLPALGALDLIVALGGTSNHFRSNKLRGMGGWDPYNVTEDLDLGVVIKRDRGHVLLLDSVTWEEANARPFGKGGWVSQRSRWIKGHMQSWFVHMRNPLHLYQDLGFWNFLMFQLIILGSPLSLVLSPLYLGLTALYLASRTVLTLVQPESAFALQMAIEALFPSYIYYAAIVSFVLGNLGIMYSIMLACVLREQYKMVKYIFLAPIYWLMMSAAAWKASWQLITKPHYWEKTSHGHATQPVETGRVSESTHQVETGTSTLQIVDQPAASGKNHVA